MQLNIDDVVTRPITQVVVYIIQRPPYGQMPVALVHILVHDKERQFFVCQSIDKRSAVFNITTISARSHARVYNGYFTHHKQARE